MNEQHPSISAVGAHLDEEIAKLARRYYDEEGQPEGRAEEHWLRAERELREQNANGSRGEYAHAEATADATEEAMHLAQ